MPRVTDEMYTLAFGGWVGDFGKDMVGQKIRVLCKEVEDFFAVTTVRSLAYRPDEKSFRLVCDAFSMMGVIITELECDLAARGTWTAILPTQRVPVFFYHISG